MDRSITTEKLLEVWDAYVEFRRPYVEETTYIRDYGKIRKRILEMKKSSTLEDGYQIRDWVLNRYSPETARKTLIQFNAATAWGEFSRILPTNPLNGLTRYLATRRKPADDSYVAFLPEERAIILSAFAEHKPYYFPWVQFLFFTGCRPEEAAALRWKHVARDFSELLIQEAIPADCRIAKRTKNLKTTRFPCNQQLKRLLISLKPYPKCNLQDFVFVGPRGAWFDYGNFSYRHWKPMIEKLTEEGHLAFYLPQYNCRHTFITEMLKKNVDIKTISYLCRVTPAVILNNYASRDRNIEIPEF